jgi:hypothetical protein
VALPDPCIHLYWAYALAKAEEMFKVTRFPPGFCGAQAEREYVTLDPKKITCPSCRERAGREAGVSRRDKPWPVRACLPTVEPLAGASDD